MTYEINEQVKIKIGYREHDAVVTGFSTVVFDRDTMNNGFGQITAGTTLKVVKIKLDDGAEMQVFESELYQAQEDTGEKLTDFVDW